VALNFLGRWFGAKCTDTQQVDEVRAELTRLAAERPAFAAPLRWLKELLPDLIPVGGFLPGPVLKPAQVRAKLESGAPLLRGEQLKIDAKAVRKRWERACAALEALQPEGATADLAKAVQRGDVDPVALANAIVNGQPDEVRDRLEALHLDPTLAITLLRYSLFAVFSALSALLAPLREGTVWEHGFCPTCGSWPLLGEFRGLDQSRYLRCGLCASDWEVPRLWCPFCKNRDHERLSFLHVEGEEMKQRVATCDECRGYVKMVSTLSTLPPLALLLADAATLHLDLAAGERGFTNVG